MVLQASAQAPVERKQNGLGTVHLPGREKVAGPFGDQGRDGFLTGNYRSRRDHLT
jgi:hypothetical protein